MKKKKKKKKKGSGEDMTIQEEEEIFAKQTTVELPLFVALDAAAGGLLGFVVG